jgi:hypothetical protein
VEVGSAIGSSRHALRVTDPRSGGNRLRSGAMLGSAHLARLFRFPVFLNFFFLLSQFPPFPLLLSPPGIL